jgi:DNA-binding IscR family transcriptional regulator
MLRLTKKLLFAIEAVLDIAYNAGNMPVQSGDITGRQGIPRRYLEQVLQQLVRANILEGVRGVRTLESGDDPLEGEAGSMLGGQVVRPLWAELQEELMKRLDNVTIEELCTRAHHAGIAGEYAARLDFSI